MPGIFFTSDEHHGHRNIITKFQFRPFDSLEEMTEGLIERHNAKVGRGDLVYHLGDMFWRTFGLGNAVNVMRRLNGNHYYILGNHEELMLDKESEALRNHFVWVKERIKIRPNSILAPEGIVLDHYAARVWNGSHKGAWQLYGHSHGELPEDLGFAFDVGVDPNNYSPVSIEEAAVRMKEKAEERFSQSQIEGSLIELT